MGVEIEKKFLVDRELWQKVKPDNGVHIAQGYIKNTPQQSVRVRIKGEYGFLTIKGGTDALQRTEFEYEIPLSDAKELLTDFCQKQIIKIRYTLQVDNEIWEVDEFESPRNGLILAEIELTSVEQSITLPNWITEEVTGQAQYYNAEMLREKA